MSLWDGIQNFSPDEFTCPCCGENRMKMSFILSLDSLRSKCNFPFVISSGYRCPSYNDEVSTTGLNGPHTTGQAVDVVLFGRQAYDVLSFAPRFGFTGIGLHQKGEHGKRFIHLDTLGDDHPRPWVWTY